MILWLLKMIGRLLFILGGYAVGLVIGILFDLETLREVFKPENWNDDIKFVFKGR